MGLWTWIKGIGGNRDEQSDLQEELGAEDAGAAEEKYLSEAGFGAQTAGLSYGDAADVANADLDEFKPPPDPAP
jgi:hypothetical protein